AGNVLHHEAALVVVARNRHDDNLIRREARWQAKPFVVAMRHDDAADHAPAYAPRGCPAVLKLVVAVKILDVEGFGEVLSEIVAGSALERTFVAHHALDGISAQS